MRAMLLHRPGEELVPAELPVPVPGEGQVLLRVAACGVCRTDLHIVDGELHEAALPLVPGHQIVGRVERLGAGVTRFALGARVGVPWLAGTCGACAYCSSGRENLCPYARFTGYHGDGGYAEYALADARFCFSDPGRVRRRACCAALVRGPDRLPCAVHVWRCAPHRPVRLRRGCAHRAAGDAPPGP